MVKNLSLKKAKLRKKTLLIRNSLKKYEVKKISEIICKKILSLNELRENTSFLIYLPINNEVDTKLIIEGLKRNDKQVFSPKFFNSQWSIVEFTSWDDLEHGPFGILQPKGNGLVDVKKIDVALIVGLAFDRKGTRLGYGKGVYDKLLKNFNGSKIGLAYDFQIVDKLPKEEHDLCMDLVVSERKVVYPVTT